MVSQMKNGFEEINRLRQEYKRRKLNGDNDLYSLFYRPYLFTLQQRQKKLLTAVKNLIPGNIDEQNILEVGCGGGDVLLEYHTLGIPMKRITGIDLLFDRLQEAKQKLPDSSICNSDGQHLSFCSNSFNIVVQYTAFSSILDKTVKQNMASEMLRVLRSQGAIIWYDFWLNPTNRQTKGIRPGEIRDLFPNCLFKFYKITLAPPIARKLIPISWPLGIILESMKVFNTHYLVFIQKNEYQKISVFS